jgi:hypothetical protein
VAGGRSEPRTLELWAIVEAWGSTRSQVAPKLAPRQAMRAGRSS